MFRVQITGERAVINMARAVADGPDHLRQNLARAIRNAAQPTLAAVKKAAEKNRIRGYRRGGKPYTGPDGPGGLRERMAAAVELDLNVGSLSPRAQFLFHTARVGAGRVPEYIEAGVIWRHPIMGNRHAWAAQKGTPFFERTVEKHRPLFERRTNEAVERTARAINRGA